MASTLLHIKSKMLLPPSPEQEEEVGEDPRAELVRRLLEYQKYKEAATELWRRPLLDRDVFIRTAPEETGEPEQEERIDVNLFELLEAFRQVLEKAAPEVFHEVMLEQVTVEERIQDILSLLERENRSVAFYRLFPEQASRKVIVVTFLAILELVKMRRVRVFQMAPFEVIRISMP
jgi:segregation and condensation protein A